MPDSRLRLLYSLAIALMCLLVAPMVASAQPAGFLHRFIAGGITNPTAMALAPDGRLFVCQQNGALRIIKNGALLQDAAMTLNVDPTGERGLLGIAFDTNFPGDPYVYLYYTVPSPAHNRVSRFTVTGDTASVASEVILLELDPLSGATNHNGGTLKFGPNNKLFIAVGDNAFRDNAQSLETLHGKMLRINEDGTIPDDNPFNAVTSGKYQAIWAYGLRNPFSFAFQTGTNRMFINDVGESTFEEINDGIAGSNYGWPSCEGKCAIPNPNFRDPIYYYGRGGGPHVGCAITSGAFYNPTTPMLPSQYVGKYFFFDFCNGWIDYIDPLNPPAVNGATSFGNVVTSFPVSLLVAPNGTMFYASRGGSGEVWTIEAGTAPPGTGGPSSLGNLDIANCTTISGWAADPAQPNIPIQVDIVADSLVIATIIADIYRPDVQAAGFGDGRKGFSFTVPDTLKDGLPHTITARTTSSNRVLYSTPKLISCGSIGPGTFGGPSSLGNLEVVNCNVISGWAADPAQPNTSINVDILSDGQVIATVVANLSRPDVQAAGYGNALKGFSFTVPASLKNGVGHLISVRISGLNIPLYNSPKVIACTTGGGLSTGGPASLGNFDVANCAVFSGWASDLAQPNTPINVDIFADGQLIGTVLANQSRPDVQAAGYGNALKGFSFAVPAALKNGQPHAIVVRTTGLGILLYSNPKIITCN